jgi:shikimate dehydrogenase
LAIFLVLQKHSCRHHDPPRRPSSYAGADLGRSASIRTRTGSNDPTGYDIVVNATPLGMGPSDAMPMDVSRISPSALVGDVVMKKEMTAFLQAAKGQGCEIQFGIDMLFEQIPAYLEFFGFPVAMPEQLRAIAQIDY